MEVSPELYAWLSSLNIIEPFSEIDENNSKTYFIPENMVEALFEGHYFDKMILNLQDAYNKHFNNRKNCEPKLKELAFKEKKYNKISSKTKLNNWNVINDALQFFDIKFSKNEISKIMSGNRDILLKVITKIFNSILQLLKYTKKDLTKENIKLLEKNSSNDKKLDIFTPKINMASINSNKKENTLNESDKKSSQKENSILTSRKNKKLKNNNKNNLEKTNLLNNENYNNEINSDKNNNNNNQDILSSKKPLTEFVDITKLSINTSYEKCTTALEFFIVSLCKNYKIKPSQAIGLLSNNRQYLSVLCKSGINGNYLTINKWLEDLQINFDILLKLILKFDDGVYMAYCIIGTALCSKNLDVSVYAIDLLSQLYKNVGLNIPWFIKFGINSFIFTFIKHKSKILYFLNSMCDFIQSNEAIFFQEIKNKINSDSEYKTLIFDIFPTLIPPSTKIKNKNFITNFQNFILDICLHEETKLSYSVSLLCEGFFNYHEIITDDIENKIILFFKKSIRSFSSNTYGSTIAKIFVLITKISKSYNQYAPGILKCMVALFIEMYDDIIRREIFLENFGNFLYEQNQVPLDIFFEKYINKIKSCNNYNICDFNFLWKIIDHPRFEFNYIINVVNFLLKVFINNNIFNRCAIFIMQKILNDYYPRIDNSQQIESLSQILISHINQVLELSLNNIKNEGEKNNNEVLLEMSYIIVQNDIGNVNETVKNDIIEYAKQYFFKYENHSGICLGMLKKYQDFSNILNKIEEKK